MALKAMGGSRKRREKCKVKMFFLWYPVCEEYGQITQPTPKLDSRESEGENSAPTATYN